jgi:hypothetical protein
VGVPAVRRGKCGKNKKLEPRSDPIGPKRALEHDPEKLADIWDKIMRQNKDFDVAHD